MCGKYYDLRKYLFHYFESSRFSSMRLMVDLDVDVLRGFDVELASVEFDVGIAIPEVGFYGVADELCYGLAFLFCGERFVFFFVIIVIEE